MSGRWRWTTDVLSPVCGSRRWPRSPEAQPPCGSPARDVEPPGPAGSRVPDVLGRGRARLQQREPERAVDTGQRVQGLEVQHRETHGRVPLHYRQEHQRLSGGPKKAVHSVDEPRLGADGTAQQRSPRERDSQLVYAAVELCGEGLGGSQDEQRVGQAAPPRLAGGKTRRVAHRGGIRVGADDERGRVVAGPPDDRGTIAGTEVQDQSLAAAGQRVELADVHFRDPTAGDDLHRRILPAAVNRPRQAVQNLGGIRREVALDHGQIEGAQDRFARLALQEVAEGGGHQRDGIV